ncbi:MAG: hypothetical protein HYZ90_07225 [Candidatus Omnitrophica bacterium]|nr:hypothetical protein [Candidatus Omnitrophota bacterium]
MSIRTTLVGSYPKVSHTGADNLPGAIDRWQRKFLSDEALEQEVQKVIRRVLREQEEAGLDLVTDGQIRWEDLPHPIARSAQGISRGALRRFFDNNVYYRRLETNGGLQWVKSAAAEDFEFASSNSRQPVKAVLPGPLTLAISTEPKPGQTPERLLALYSQLLRREVEALAAAGAKEIQIDEPSLRPQEPLLSKAVVEEINGIFGGIRARRWVACYFQDLAPILSELTRLQVEVLSLDLVSRSNGSQLSQIADHLQRDWKGEISLGLIDARNTKLESAEALKQSAAVFAQAIPADRLWLSPNCGLEFLPHESAVKKLSLLSEAARRL